MDYPVIVGSGLKGPAVAWLTRHIDAPVFFLDDIPHNIDSVAEWPMFTASILLPTRDWPV